MDGRRGDDWQRDENSWPLFIGEGAKIGTGAVIEPYSIIGKNSIVSNYSHLQKVLFLQMPTLGSIVNY